jgi:2Fe-2S ferredoxin
MGKHTANFTDVNGVQKAVEIEDGISLMEAARANGVVGIMGDCGGGCACATCHVYVDDTFIDRLPPPDDMESELLDGVAAERLPGSRLSCQIAMTAELDGLTVRIPRSQA